MIEPTLRFISIDAPMPIRGTSPRVGGESAGSYSPAFATPPSVPPSRSMEPAMQRLHSRSLCSLAVAGALFAAARSFAAASAEAPADPAPQGSPSFGEDRLWDDGKAELSRYAAEEIVEGEKRSFTAWSVIVAEHFDPKQMVKKDGWDAAFVPLLKCNWFLQIPTGIYSYQQMASLFLRRSDGLVMKASFSSQEWCGTTFAEWRRDRPGLEIHSYWDGEGDQRHELPDLSTNVLFTEQLPLWIRGRHPGKARSEAVKVIAKRIATSKCPPPAIADATIAFDGPAGDAPDAPLVARLVVGDKVDTFRFARDFPHVMEEWARADGTKWTLEKSVRLDYWKYSRNEFAELLK